MRAELFLPMYQEEIEAEKSFTRKLMKINL